MTFIASVIAKNGCAVIADSLVTTSKYVLDHDEFIMHCIRKSKSNGGQTVTFDIQEISNLFNSKPHHTKNYEEKLIEYDDYTAITTAGAAEINKKRIAVILEEIKSINKTVKGYNNKKIETKVQDLCHSLNEIVVNQLNNGENVGGTVLILTHYSRTKKVCSIFRIRIGPASVAEFRQGKNDFVTFTKAEDYEKVVCEGQNGITDHVLFGSFPMVFAIIPRIVDKMIQDFNIPLADVPSDYIESIRRNKALVPYDTVRLLNLSELSIQQAVDLASLLMRLVIDFQSYTEDIPTVGGVIKLAVIDNNGFNYITGHSITKPANI